MKKLFVLISILSTICITANTNHAQYWDVIFGAEGSIDDHAKFVQQTTDGGYVVGGESDFNIGYTDIWLLKLDSSANIMWQKAYGKSGYWFDDSSIIQIIDRGYIVAIKNFLFKLDSNGNILWQKSYQGESSNPSFYSIHQTDDEGYIVVGLLFSQDYDLFVMKLDHSGSVIWKKTYGGTRADRALSVDETFDGGYIVAGNTTSFGAGGEDTWVLKLDSNGNIIWQKTYGGSSSESLLSYKIIQTSDGGYILGSETYSFGLGYSDAWVLKLDYSGSVIWQKTYGGIGYDFASSIEQTVDGDYIVAGYTSSFGTGGYDGLLIKLDSNGNIIWQKTYGGTNGAVLEDIYQTSDSGYIVAGSTLSFGGGGSDFWVLKLDSDGEMPNCEIVGTSDVSPINTTITGQDSSATIQSPSLTVTDADLISLDTVAVLSVACTSQIDPDEDDIPYDIDNCPFTYNPDQLDFDGDGVGNSCDNNPFDYDNDGICYPGESHPTCIGSDNCPLHYNPDQLDADEDGVGDVCDDCIDMDDDTYGSPGFPSNTCPLDNCPNTVNPGQADTDGDGFGDVCDDHPYLFDPLPAADGHYFSYFCCYCCGMMCSEECCDVGDGIDNGIKIFSGHLNCYNDKAGILEFDISSIDGSFARGQMQAVLSLTVKEGDLPADRCLSLYSIQDANENGIIEEVDTDSEDHIAEVCEDLQQGDTITFNVTSAIEHDLFSSNQTSYSGFVIKIGSDSSDYPDDYMEFNDHTDIANAPRLSISELVCPISLIYGTNSAETQLLRSIRDNVLSQSHEGRELIKLYYQWSPLVVKAMHEDVEFREDVKEMIDGVLVLITEEK